MTSSQTSSPPVGVGKEGRRESKGGEQRCAGEAMLWCVCVRYGGGGVGGSDDARWRRFMGV